MKIPDDMKNIDFTSIDVKDRKTQVLLLAVLVTLAAVVLYIYFVFAAQAIRVFTLIGDTVRVRAELKSARTLVSGIEGLKDDLKKHSDKVESYEKKLPAEQEIPVLLENLSNMAKDSNIKIIGIAPAAAYFKDDKSVKKSTIYQEIPILITAKSGYHELGRFLASLENADRFMKVVDISIKANKVSPREHDVELMICTYVLLGQK